MGALHPNFIVGIGGSAGSLNPLKALMDAMPSTLGMAYVIVPHLMPSANTQMVAILSRHTKMPVLLVGAGGGSMPISANHVYVIAPNTDLLIEGNAFKVVSPRSGRNRQVDIFLTSLAQAKGTRAVGVILSGYHADGAEGCKEIRAKGGTCFAQDSSAEASGMPLSAQATGCVDFVLAPDKIPDELRKLARTAKN